MRIWAVKMGNFEFPNVVASNINVATTTLKKAISKAESIERALCAEMNFELDTGEEKIVPNKAIAVELLCEVEE